MRPNITAALNIIKIHFHIKLNTAVKTCKHLGNHFKMS